MLRNPTEIKDYEFICAQVYTTTWFFFISLRSWVIKTENVKSSRDEVTFQESQLPVKIVASTNGWEDLSLLGWSQFYEVYALTHNDLLNVTMQELMSYFKSQISSWCLGTQENLTYCIFNYLDNILHLINVFQYNICSTSPFHISLKLCNKMVIDELKSTE